MSRDWCHDSPHGIRITVQLAPNAKKTEVAGVLDDALKIRVHAQPIEGKANDVLVRYLADVLALPKSAISITHGHASKRKIIEITASLSIDEVKRLLAA